MAKKAQVDQTPQHRFFVPADKVEGGVVTLDGTVAHQIANVLRMGAGERICVLDNSGWQMEAELSEVAGGRVVAQIVRRSLARGEPKVKVSLYQAMLKGQNLEFALQKCTELGVVEFIPVITARCVIACLDDVNRKMERWQRVVQEAAEQSRRGRLPVLEPAMLFTQACERARHGGGWLLMPWEGEHSVGLREILTAGPLPFSINLLIGPEGGFQEEEVRLAQAYGAQPVSLGPRVLRAETAGLVAASAILYQSGDLDPLP